MATDSHGGVGEKTPYIIDSVGLIPEQKKKLITRNLQVFILLHARINI